MKKSALAVIMLTMVAVVVVPAVAQLAEDSTGAPGSASADRHSSASGIAAESRDLIVEPIPADALSGTLPVSDDPSFDFPRVLVAPSADALSSGLGVGVPDRGEGTYVAALRGGMGTPGYYVYIETARLEGDSVTLGISLTGEGGQVEMVDYPYAVAVVREPDLLDKNFSLVDQYGQELTWPVQSAGG